MPAVYNKAGYGNHNGYAERKKFGSGKMPEVCYDIFGKVTVDGIILQKIYRYSYN